MSTKNIILFDGVCNLCNGAITFIIKRDKKDIFLFTPLQSTVGKKLAAKHHIDLEAVDSIILVTPKKAYIKSTAALHIARHLSGGYPLLAAFLVVPALLRNWVYDFIARNRYRWFGQTDACMIPTPELKAKFIDNE